jgi:ribose 5-phosphate isomerase B
VSEAEGAVERVHLGCDHAGFELKELLKGELTASGFTVVDHGPAAYDAQDDYPPFCLAAAQAVAGDRTSLGIVIGGSGNGEQMAANKVDGVRAALAWSVETAQLAREHNNANVVSIGARMHTPDVALEIVRTFLATPFSNDARHVRRINQLTEFENTGIIPTVG